MRPTTQQFQKPNVAPDVPKDFENIAMPGLQWSLASVAVALFLFPSSASAMLLCFITNTKIKQEAAWPALSLDIFQQPPMGR